MENFSERLKTMRADSGKRQKDIADAIGITSRAYQYYENGTKEPTLSKIIALADYFDVSIDYLVGRTNNPKVNR